MGSLAYDTDHYMRCPGPRVDGKLAGTCTAVIPKVIVCTGANPGKRCQACKDCSYFMWLPFEGSASPSPNSKALRQASSTSSGAWAPLPLAAQGTAVLRDSQAGWAPSPAFLSQKPSSSQKAPCARGLCKHPRAAACSKAMCKGCCLLDSASICMYKGYNSGHYPFTTSDDPFHMPKPQPLFPLYLPTSTNAPGLGQSSQSSALDTLSGHSSALSDWDPSLATSSGSPSLDLSLSTSAPTQPASQHPFYFSKPIPPAVAADYNERRLQREHRHKAETERVENERRIKHTVLLLAYLRDGVGPTPLPLQDINTWPTLNLAKLPHLKAQLGLQDDEEVEIYARTAHGSFWVPTLDYSMNVKTDDQIFICRKGVHTDAHPSMLVSQLDSTHPASFKTPSRKRACELTPPPSRLSKKVHIDLTLDDPASLLCSLAHCCQIFLIWLSGCVITPGGQTAGSPTGIRIIKVTLTRASESFCRVFNGMVHKPSTYHLNRGFWERLSPSVQAEACSLPRNEDGLWANWRKRQSSWSTR
ncbi:hypothetical protein CVT26_004381 [Gymnopilus dilepis]|uniref:Uncharacterized protein n=1 Tax=Gymnopilus dilepis TaxID=231916 RepID=A0A409YVI8_9AGAR|nr:hypothetical protein CVT26_004381 [Gymnopilus dilepis]